MNVQSSFDSIQPPAYDAQAVGRGAAAGAAGIEPPSRAASMFDGDTTYTSHAALSAVASNLSDVRAGKVAELRQTLANGAYAVSPSEVAGKLIDKLLQS